MKRLQDLRAGVIGTGFIGALHVETLRRIGVTVAGVAGSSSERARDSALKLGVPRGYADYAELIADPTIDVVHITSPNGQHYLHAKAALMAGKHVVCEKPLTTTSAESLELLRLARARGVVHAVNFNVRFYPLVREMRERVASGSLGEIRLITGSYLQDWLLYDTDWNWRLENQGQLRAVDDIGSHWLDAVTYITGHHITEVMAELTTFIPIRKKPIGSVQTFARATDAQQTVDYPVHSEDAGSILLRFDSGARGTLTVSQVSPGRKNAISLEIDGSASSVSWLGEQPDTLWIGHRDKPNEQLLRDPSLLSPRAAHLAGLPGGHAEGFSEAFKALYTAIYTDVARGTPSPSPDYATFADGVEEAIVGDAIAKSARESRWTPVERKQEESL